MKDKNIITFFSSYHGGGSSLAAVIFAIEKFQEDSRLKIFSNIVLNELMYTRIVDLSPVDSNSIVLLDDISPRGLLHNPLFKLLNEKCSNIYWIVTIPENYLDSECIYKMSSFCSVDCFSVSFSSKSEKVLNIKHRGTSRRRQVLRADQYYGYFNTLSLGHRI